MSKNKVAIIGFDVVSLDSIEQWAKRNMIILKLNPME